MSPRWIKWEAAKLSPIQRLFRSVQREREEGQRLSILEAVKAMEKRIKELRPVASIACVIAMAFQPAKPKLIIKKTTMKDVTQVVILQPWRCIKHKRKYYLDQQNWWAHPYYVCWNNYGSSTWLHLRSDSIRSDDESMPFQQPLVGWTPRRPLTKKNNIKLFDTPLWTWFEPKKRFCKYATSEKRFVTIPWSL